MKISITLPEHFQEKSIRDVLEKDFLIPRKVRHFLRIRRNVWVNQEKAMFHEVVRANDTLTLLFDDTDYKLPSVAAGNKKNLQILFEDEHMIIVNKPNGMKTHPNNPGENGTLLNDLADYLQDKGEFPYVVHRLDKETSGAILFAKNPIILPVLGRMLENKEIHREYQAITDGLAREKDFTISKKIGRDPSDNRKRMVDEKRGKVAITHAHTVKVDKEKRQSFLEIVLDTGRTHQIRVHLKSYGTPIVGDPLYNEKSPAPRLCLHAKKLWFEHPFSQEKIEVETMDGLY